MKQLEEKRTSLNNRTDAEYFFRMSGIFRICKYACALVFALFMVMMLFVYGDKITYQNFRYMLKDIDAAALLNTDAIFERVAYNENDPTFAVLNGNLVVAGSDDVSLYNPAGIRVYSIPITAQNLCLHTAGRYMLVYDAGGLTYTLCNSITTLAGGTASHTVYNGAVSTSGAFALVKASDKTRYAVEVYTPALRLGATYGLNDYVADVALSDDGSRIAILSFTNEGDTYRTTLRFGTLGEESFAKAVSFEEAFPVSVSWQGDSVTVVTDKSIRFYDSAFAELREYSLEGATLTCTCIGADGFAAAYVKNGKNVIVMFDREGNVRYNETEAGRIRDLAFCENGLLILTVKDAKRVSLHDFSATVSDAEGALRIFGVSDYGLLCGKDAATAIFTGK